MSDIFIKIQNIIEKINENNKELIIQQLKNVLIMINKIDNENKIDEEIKKNNLYEEKRLVISRKIIPVIRQEIVPPVSGEIQQIVHEEIQPVVHNEFQQVITRQIQPVVRKEIAPVIKREIQPVVRKEIDPVIKREIQPVVHKKIQPILHKEIQPVLTKEIRELILKKFPPIVHKEIQPIIHVEIKPVITKEIQRIILNDIKKNKEIVIDKEIKPVIDDNIIIKDVIKPVLPGHKEPIFKEKIQPVIKKIIRPVFIKDFRKKDLKNNWNPPIPIIKDGILNSKEEFDLLVDKINENNSQIILYLNYKATIDSDKASVFHKECDEAKSTLVLIKSKNGKRFGGYTSCSWKGDSKVKKDENAFLFSLDKMKVYPIISGQDAIGCYPENGPVFMGFQILIKDNFFKNGGTTYLKGINYNTEEDYELTGGLKEFEVEEIEVYEVSRE